MAEFAEYARRLQKLSTSDKRVDERNFKEISSKFLEQEDEELRGFARFALFLFKENEKYASQRRKF